MSTQKTLSMVDVFPLRPAINKLLSESNASIAIKYLCKDYTEKLKSGKFDDELCESFVVELSKVANSEVSKSVLNELNEALVKNETNIRLAKCIHALENSSCRFVAPVIESAVVEYMLNKNSMTRDDVRVALSLFESEGVVRDILETVEHESYMEKSGNSLVNAKLNESFAEPKAKTYTEEEVNAIINDRLNEAKKEEAAAKAEKKHIPSHIGLSGMISKIVNENRSNEKLKVFCNQYVEALNAGRPEELLYESFVSGISNWNYLSAVDTELSALRDRLTKYKQDIDLKKILELMSQTESYYIVPLIEDVVADYVDRKNMTNRYILMQRLEAFERDPFVRDIMNVITKDMSIENSVYLGESVEGVNKYVHTELVYSPIHTISESECVFNVKGSYFSKKGNSISKLTRGSIAALPESYRGLCNLVNSSNVQISNINNTITVFKGENKAVISESEIIVNGKKMSSEDIRRIVEGNRYMDYDELPFYTAVDSLNEHFDDIAYLNFVKRVVSNDNSGNSVDVFRVKDNIFVNTVNERLGSSVFYRNVNPIQCKKYINEAMEINVSSLFEDVLPDQEKVEKGIENKKKEYQSYIDELEDKKETLQKMKGEGMDTEDIDNAIELIDKEIEDTKNDFKQFQDDSDKYMNGDDDDAEDTLKNEPNGDDAEGDDNDADDDNDDEKTPADDMDDADKETPDEMTVPLTGDNGDNTADVPVDNFSDDLPDNIEINQENGSDDDEFADVPEFDDFDFALPANDGNSDMDNDMGQDNGADMMGQEKPAKTGFEVVRVSYNKNVKTGTSNGKGEVFVIIPSVDANGDVHDETRKVTFYLDPERKPVINNEYMPLDMYNAISKAIEECPETESVNLPSESDETAESSSDVPAAIEASPVAPANDVETAPSVPEKTAAVKPEPAKEVPVEPVERETPAEVKDKADEVDDYPITVGLYPEEIAPKSMDDFQKDLDDMKIAHSESEAADGEICCKIGNKAQAHAFRNYFKEWMNYSPAEFNSFFPELKRCFDNKPTNIPVAPANENVTVNPTDIDRRPLCENFSVTLPSTKAMCDLFGIRPKKNNGHMVLIPESMSEVKKIYRTLSKYATNHTINQDTVDAIENLQNNLRKIDESETYMLRVPYNGFLSQILESKGIDVRTNGKDMSMIVNKGSYNKVRKALIDFYGKSMCESAIEFVKYVNRLNENVKIIVKDETTGKTVEIDTDDINGKMSDNTDTVETEQADFESSFKNATFDPEKSIAFKDDEESADEEKKETKESADEGDEDKESKKGEDENAADDKDSEETDNDKDGEEEDGSEDKESEDEKPKKKFKFKASKKSNESVAVRRDASRLNEGADVQICGHGKPDVLDFVKLSNGTRGQIICKQADGNFIVNVMGHTVLATPKEVSLTRNKFDTLDTPFKYDKNTLQGCYESFVTCGLYVNDVCVTPRDCKIQINEFVNAADDQEVNIVIEGQSTPAMKKYIKLDLEEVNEALDLGKYRPGHMMIAGEKGAKMMNVLVHYGDYVNYRNLQESVMPVRVLSFDSNKVSHLVFAPGSAVSLNESDEFCESGYDNLFESAIRSLK